MKIPLFDIDSTLLEGGNKAHINCFDYALKTVYGLHDASVVELKLDGMIDKQILVEILKLHNVSEETAKARMEEAMLVMVEYFTMHLHESTSKVLPGVKELLNVLIENNMTLGLLTGNIEDIAWGKLKNIDLADYFSFGSFGNLAYKRVELIAIAKERAEKLLKKEIPLQDFFIVGDSPLDIVCAKAGGINVVAVAQGNFTVEELETAGADIVLHSMEERDAFLDFIKD